MKDNTIEVNWNETLNEYKAGLSALTDARETIKTSFADAAKSFIQTCREAGLVKRAPAGVEDSTGCHLADANAAKASFAQAQLGEGKKWSELESSFKEAVSRALPKVWRRKQSESGKPKASPFKGERLPMKKGGEVAEFVKAVAALDGGTELLKKHLDSKRLDKTLAVSDTGGEVKGSGSGLESLDAETIAKLRAAFA